MNIDSMNLLANNIKSKSALINSPNMNDAAKTMFLSCKFKNNLSYKEYIRSKNTPNKTRPPCPIKNKCKLCVDISNSAAYFPPTKSPPMPNQILSRFSQSTIRLHNRCLPEKKFSPKYFRLRLLIIFPYGDLYRAMYEKGIINEMSATTQNKMR